MPSRRSFLKQASLASAGFFVPYDSILAPHSPIGLQLFTVRKQIAQNPEATLAEVAKIGYTSVEIFGYENGKFFGKTPAQFSELLKKYKFKTPSGHYMPINFLTKGDQDELKDHIATASAMGHSYITIPFLFDNMRTSLDDYKRLAENLNIAAAEARKAGLQLAYHNHNFEFKNWGNGQTGFDILLQKTDPSQVYFELDIYWVVRAGFDPLKLIKDHPGRFKMWHVKNMTQKMDPTYDVGGPQYFGQAGTGIIDYKTLFRYKKESGLEYFFVEQDETSIPVYDAITHSFKYVKNNLIR